MRFRAMIALAFLLLTSLLFGEDRGGTIHVVPLGKVSRHRILESVRAVESCYRARVVIDRREALPRSAFYTPRKRYRAEKLLTFLQGKGQGGDKVIGITDKDISTRKGTIADWGVMGLGQLGGRSCVVSSFRIHNDPYFAATVIHELGHTFGLPHCPTRGCVMQDYDSGKRLGLDSSRRFCTKCGRILNRLGVLR